jgi:hypothetical protein
MIEVVGSDVNVISLGRRNYNQKQNDSISSMTRVLETCDPFTYSYEQGKFKWEKAMNDEMDSLLKNHTWDLSLLPKGKNIVKCRWVYKIKFTFEVVVEFLKDHLFVKGFSQ